MNVDISFSTILKDTEIQMDNSCDWDLQIIKIVVYLINFVSKTGEKERILFANMLIKKCLSYASW